MDLIVLDYNKNKEKQNGKNINDAVLLVGLNSISDVKPQFAQVVRYIDVPKVQGNPINYRIVNNSIVEDSGNFDRLKGSNAVILGSVVDKSKKTLGYRVIMLSNGNITISNLQKEVIISNFGKDRVLQNAIIRNDTISPFGGYSFREISADDLKANKDKVSKVKQKEKEKKKKGKISTNLEDKTKSGYTNAQLQEIKLAKHNGVEDTSCIENPKLSVEQMRTIWLGKKNNALVEYFNKPEYKGMEFYSKTLFSHKDVEDCKEFLKHPEFSSQRLAILYDAKMSGEYTPDMLNKDSLELRSDENLKAAIDLIDNGTSDNYELDMSDLAAAYDRVTRVARRLSHKAK